LIIIVYAFALLHMLHVELPDPEDGDIADIETASSAQETYVGCVQPPLDVAAISSKPDSESADEPKPNCSKSKPQTTDDSTPEYQSTNSESSDEPTPHHSKTKSEPTLCTQSSKCKSDGQAASANCCSNSLAVTSKTRQRRLVVA